MKRSLLSIALLMFAVPFLPVACSSKKPNPPVTASNQDAASQYYTPPEPDSGVAAVASDDAGAEGGFTTSPTSTLGTPSLSVDGGGTAQTPTSPEGNDQAIDAAITAAAAKLAPKMDREGQPGRATLKEGEHFGMLVTMSPGRCYTIIGFSPAGNVTQLDLKLMAPPLYNIESGRSGANEKNQPVIAKGASAMCPVLPLPVAYKIDAAATKGSGRIGVQVFSRNK